MRAPRPLFLRTPHVLTPVPTGDQRGRDRRQRPGDVPGRRGPGSS